MLTQEQQTALWMMQRRTTLQQAVDHLKTNGGLTLEESQEIVDYIEASRCPVSAAEWLGLQPLQGEVVLDEPVELPAWTPPSISLQIQSEGG